MIVPRLIASKEDTSYISDFSSSILKVPAATSISSEYNIKQKNREKKIEAKTVTIAAKYWPSESTKTVI